MFTFTNTVNFLSQFSTGLSHSKCSAQRIKNIFHCRIKVPPCRVYLPHVQFSPAYGRLLRLRVRGAGVIQSTNPFDFCVYPPRRSSHVDSRKATLRALKHLTSKMKVFKDIFSGDEVNCPICCVTDEIDRCRFAVLLARSKAFFLFNVNQFHVSLDSTTPSLISPCLFCPCHVQASECDATSMMDLMTSLRSFLPQFLKRHRLMHIFSRVP